LPQHCGRCAARRREDFSRGPGGEISGYHPKLAGDDWEQAIHSSPSPRGDPANMDMIPEKAAVPTRAFRFYRKPHQKTRFAVTVRNGKIDAESDDGSSWTSRLLPLVPRFI
jgi:hypothetical protein